MSSLVRLRATPPSAPGASAPADLGARVAALETEREELWNWIFHLERLSQSGLMAGGMAHDARNLLTGIAANCQTALLVDDPSRFKETLAQADTLARRAAEMMQVFLTFASRNGRQAACCPLEAVVEDVRRFAKASLANSRVILESRVPMGTSVRGERTLLLQALLNLVLNSVRALGQAPGHVYIDARTDGDLVLVEVCDDGPGIPEPVRERLFEPFVTTAPRPGEGAPAASGTGLGLFLTRKIVEQLGGSIEVLTSEGAGTCFRLRLPAAARAATPVARPRVVA